MDNQTPVNGDRPRTKWTPIMDRCFIDIMLDQVCAGNKIRNTFRKKAWADMVVLFNTKSGLQLDKEILRNRSKKLRLQFNAVKVLLDNSGFHWDETRKMVTADDDVWDNYLKVHPEAQSYKTKTMPNYNDLCMIYGEETSDGRYNHSGHNVKLIDDIPRLMIGGVSKGLQSSDMSLTHEDQRVVRPCNFLEDHISIDRSRTNWTPTMDRYFIGIMIEQVHKGNKNGNIFRKKAWKLMVASFNTKFGLQLNKEVLRNRVKKLRLKYNAMKNLLDDIGFHWDETRQMVTADDYVWDNYLKAHPEARSYRTKTAPNYNDLCVIYGNEASSGRCNRLDHNLILADNMVEVKIDGVSGGSQSPAMSTANGDACVASQIVEEGLDNQVPPSSDRSKTNWTPPMNNYFINIMVEQVHGGFKIGKTFHKEAWTCMLASFNAKFGLQLDKQVLRTRYKKLRMQYNAMKILLDHSEFHWDETRQMVTADDFFWDDYIKAHPEARSYRTKTLPDYNSLCVIYGNETASGRYSSSGHDVNLGMAIGVSGAPQSPAMSTAHEDPLVDVPESSHSDGDMGLSNLLSKRRFETPSTSQHSRKAQKITDEGVVDALHEMALAVTLLANKKQENDSSITLENVVNALKAVPDIDEDLFLDACDLLEDAQKAKMFLALDVSIRKKWLMRKLRPQ